MVLRDHIARAKTRVTKKMVTLGAGCALTESCNSQIEEREAPLTRINNLMAYVYPRARSSLARMFSPYRVIVTRASMCAASKPQKQVLACLV